MKEQPNRQAHRQGPADDAGGRRASIQVGVIPGLERLVPGVHDPRRPIRSRFGTFKLPVRFHGRPVTLIANGALFGS